MSKKGIKKYKNIPDFDPIVDDQKLGKNLTSSQGEFALAPLFNMRDSPARSKIVKGTV